MACIHAERVHFTFSVQGWVYLCTQDIVCFIKLCSQIEKLREDFLGNVNAKDIYFSGTFV